MATRVATLCAFPYQGAGSAILIASNRSIVRDAFEPAVPAPTEIAPCTLAIAAGDPLESDRFIDCLGRYFASVTPSRSVEHAAEMAAAYYEHLRREQVDARVFKPRDIDMKAFFLRNLALNRPKDMDEESETGDDTAASEIVDEPEESAAMIHRQAVAYIYPVEALICGKDHRGTHLFIVSDPGKYEEVGPSGRAAIGVGARAAREWLDRAGISPDWGLHEAAFAVYAAARQAIESLPGLGTFDDEAADVDLTLIWQGGIEHLHPGRVRLLAPLYREYCRGTALFGRARPSEMAARVSDLGLFRRRGDLPSPNLRELRKAA
jgi:hypothetical protein